MREVHELVLFEVEPASTLTGFLKNSILVGRDLSFRQKKMDRSFVSQEQSQFQ